MGAKGSSLRGRGNIGLYSHRMKQSVSVRPSPPLAIFISPPPSFRSLQFAAKVKAGAQYVILDGFVLDVAEFAKLHPGAKARR